MTPIELYPGIIWTRDARAETAVARWSRCAGEPIGKYVRTARTWEEVRDLLRLYAADDFRDLLKEVGIRPTVTGVVVNIVVVASGMGAESYASAADDAQRLQRLENEVTGLKRHIVLLAQHDGIPNSQRALKKIDGMPVPWLVSSRASDGRTRKDETIDRRLGEVLDVLLLVAPTVVGGDPAALQEITGAIHAAGYVRLAGNSTVDFERRSRSIADGCLSYVLAACCAKTNTSPHLAEELSRSCEALVGSLVRGEIGTDGFLDRVIGEGGLCAWDVRTVLVDGHLVIGRLIGNDGALARAARGDFDEFAMHASPSANPWWKRLLQALRLTRKPEPVLRRQSLGKKAECAAALARLQAAHGFVEHVASVAGRGGSSAFAPPPAVVAAWVRQIEASVRHSLRDAVRGRQVAQGDADGIMRDLASRIASDVDGNLSTAIRDWASEVRALDEVRAAMTSDRFVIFDAQVGGGSAIRPATAIGTFAMGSTVHVHGHDIAYARVSRAPGVRPFFFVASEAIADHSLSW